MRRISRTIFEWVKCDTLWQYDTATGEARHKGIGSTDFVWTEWEELGYDPRP